MALDGGRLYRRSYVYSWVRHDPGDRISISSPNAGFYTLSGWVDERNEAEVLALT